MYALQLRMTVADVTLMADAIERDIVATPREVGTTELERILSWLRYRVAKAGITPAPPPGK